jgi:hypothetical protein
MQLVEMKDSGRCVLVVPLRHPTYWNPIRPCLSGRKDSLGKPNRQVPLAALRYQSQHIQVRGGAPLTHPPPCWNPIRP